MTVKEAAGVLRVSLSTAYRYFHSQKVRGKQESLGKKIMVYKRSVVTASDPKKRKLPLFPNFTRKLKL